MCGVEATLKTLTPSVKEFSFFWQSLTLLAGVVDKRNRTQRNGSALYKALMRPGPPSREARPPGGREADGPGLPTGGPGLREAGGPGLPASQNKNFFFDITKTFHPKKKIFFLDPRAPGMQIKQEF